MQTSTTSSTLLTSAITIATQHRTSAHYTTLSASPCRQARRAARCSRGLSPSLHSTAPRLTTRRCLRHRTDEHDEQHAAHERYHHRYTAPHLGSLHDAVCVTVQTSATTQCYHHRHSSVHRVPTPPGKSRNCVGKISRTWKVLVEMSLVLESLGLCSAMMRTADAVMRTQTRIYGITDSVTMIYLTRLKPQTIVSITYYLLNDHSMMHSESEDTSFNYLTAYTNFTSNLSL